MSYTLDDNITLVKLASKGDKEAQSKLIENNMGLIWNIVKKFGNRGYDSEDLFQIGAIGLIKAIYKFNFDYDVRFSTYAVPMIIGEIKRFIRDDGPIKVSRSIKETSNKAKITREILSKEFGREPTINEIALRLNITSEELAVALDAGVSPESLHSKVYEGDSNSILLIDKVSTDQEQEVNVINKIVITQILKELDTRERKIIILRYFKEKTQAQIAKLLGISQVQVSRIEKKIINQIKSKIEND